MAEAPIVRAAMPGRDPRPAMGYAMVVLAVVLFAANGAVSKVVLASDITSLRLSEVRSTGALLGLAAIVAAKRPRALRLRRREVPFFLVFGIFGVGFVQLFYFLSIHRLQIGVALLIQYLAPLLVALWARFGAHEPVRRRIWLALALALAGLSLVVDVWGGVSLDEVGVAFALVAALTYALYLLLAEYGLSRSSPPRDSFSLLALGFAFASLFWACVEPWWTFPARAVGRNVTLLGRLADVHLPVWSLMIWVVVLGTIAPFALIVGALRHLPATRVAIVAMLEPVLGAVVAFAWLEESLGAQQLAGGAIVLAAILLAQTAR